MYLVGKDHPHKIDAQRLLERFVVEKRRLVTDTEVFQEILHRYVAINRRDAIQPAFDLLQKLVDEFVGAGPGARPWGGVRLPATPLSTPSDV